MTHLGGRPLKFNSSTEIDLPLKINCTELPQVKGQKFIINSSIKDIFPPISKKYSVWGMNNGSFSFIEVIDWIISQTGAAHCLLSSWVASEGSIKQVFEYLSDMRFLSVKFLLDQMVPNTRGELFEYIIKKFDVDSVRITRTHCKFCVLFNEKWNIVIETSANLNKNTRLESFRITEDKNFCDFFKKLFDNLFHVIAPRSTVAQGISAPRSELINLPNIPENAKKTKLYTKNFKTPWK